MRESWYWRRLDAIVRWGEVELKQGRPGAVIATIPDLIVRPVP
ncbi:hypothetical protein [Kibdelosporangium philippinense]|nr:hypothetical protein [Kibdelosporangium philippinense]